MREQDALAGFDSLPAALALGIRSIAVTIRSAFEPHPSSERQEPEKLVLALLGVLSIDDSLSRMFPAVDVKEITEDAEGGRSLWR